MDALRERALWLWVQAHDMREDEQGASMAEYGLLLALVAVVALTALTDVGSGVSSKFQAVASSL